MSDIGKSIQVFKQGSLPMLNQKVLLENGGFPRRNFVENVGGGEGGSSKKS